jgi:hypothetical protein
MSDPPSEEILALARTLTDRLTFGDVDTRSLQLAAYLGDEPSRIVLGENAAEPVDRLWLTDGRVLNGTIAEEGSLVLFLVNGWREERLDSHKVVRVDRAGAGVPLGSEEDLELWAGGLVRWGREALVRAGIAAARAVLPLVTRLWPDVRHPHWAIETAEAHVRGEEDDREAARVAKRVEELFWSAVKEQNRPSVARVATVLCEIVGVPKEIAWSQASQGDEILDPLRDYLFDELDIDPDALFSAQAEESPWARAWLTAIQAARLAADGAPRTLATTCRTAASAVGSARPIRAAIGRELVPWALGEADLVRTREP